MEHIRFTLMAWLIGMLLNSAYDSNYGVKGIDVCLVGLEYKSDVMLPSLTVVVVSRKNILVFDISCVNIIDGWILLACSKN